MASKLLLQRRLFRFLQLSPSSFCSSSSSSIGSPCHSVKAAETLSLSTSSRSFCSQKSNLVDESHGPTPIDYRSLLEEGEFHSLADTTIHSLQEKFEDYGDSIDLDGFDIDYGNDVLTIKLGELGTYVLNKQTPNRQLWLSSPVSGPSRFDWDQDTKAWIYRRNKAKLYKILEVELEQLCGKPIVLS
ncbi:frataxin, mitochondrial [Cicer arietinum]|uniref:ferroxidase n=1 Tax=Cicer arietinum TaxID=3827 RepID=A0A1S2XT75_CICAR|nr:frataxin, mitochondrial isoform X2 [Cicer arietinum]